LNCIAVKDNINISLWRRNLQPANRQANRWLRMESSQT